MLYANDRVCLHPAARLPVISERAYVIRVLSLSSSLTFSICLCPSHSCTIPNKSRGLLLFSFWFTTHASIPLKENLLCSENNFQPPPLQPREILVFSIDSLMSGYCTIRFFNESSKMLPAIKSIRIKYVLVENVIFYTSRRSANEKKEAGRVLICVGN